MSLNASNFDQVFTANVKVVEVFRDSHKNLRVSKGRGPPSVFQRGGKGEKREKFSSVQSCRKARKRKEKHTKSREIVGQV